MCASCWSFSRLCITMHGSEIVKFHYRIHQCPPPVPFLSQLHPAHTSTSHLPKIHLSEIVSNIEYLLYLVPKYSSSKLHRFRRNLAFGIRTTVQSVGKIYLWLVLMHCLVLSLFYIRIRLNADNFSGNSMPTA